MEPIRLRASEESKNQRLDAFLASSLDGLTRSQATRLIESGEVAVDGRAVSKSYKLAGGEDIAVTSRQGCPSRSRSRPCRRTFRSTWCTRTRT